MRRRNTSALNLDPQEPSETNVKEDKSGESFYQDQQLDKNQEIPGPSEVTEKAIRQRRKPFSVDELVAGTRMLPYEERQEVVDKILSDLKDDVLKDLESEEQKAKEQQDKLDRLKKLKGE